MDAKTAPQGVTIAREFTPLTDFRDGDVASGLSCGEVEPRIGGRWSFSGSCAEAELWIADR